MKIGYIYDAVYPWETGGVQKRIWELGGRLANEHEVHWYGLRYWNGSRVIKRNGITFHGVMEPRELYVRGRRSISEALSYSCQLVQPLVNTDFDVIDCQAFPYFPAFPSKLNSMLNDNPFCITWHEVWGPYWNDYLGPIKGTAGRLVERAIMRLTDDHLAVSETTKHQLETAGVQANILPNGVDLESLEDITPATETVNVLFVGRLIKEKGPSLLVRSIGHLRDIGESLTCAIVGTGPERNRIESLIDQMQLHRQIQLHGETETYEEVIRMMKAADVFVLPSRREGFGITVLEALACGTPVVTIEHPRNAATELIDEGMTGSICQPTPKDLAEGIKNVRNSSPRACRTTAARYDWDKIAKKAESLYLDVQR